MPQTEFHVLSNVDSSAQKLSVPTAPVPTASLHLPLVLLFLVLKAFMVLIRLSVSSLLKSPLLSYVVRVSLLGWAPLPLWD